MPIFSSIQHSCFVPILLYSISSSSHKKTKQWKRGSTGQYIFSLQLFLEQNLYCLFPILVKKCMIQKVYDTPRSCHMLHMDADYWSRFCLPHNSLNSTIFPLWLPMQSIIYINCWLSQWENLGARKLQMPQFYDLSTVSETSECKTFFLSVCTEEIFFAV